MRKTTPTKSLPQPEDGALGRALFENNPLPMWFYDLDTLALLDVNEVACRKYGYTRDEFLSLTIRDIRPAQDIARLEASIRTAPPDELNAGIWKHRLRDGTLIDVEITSHEVSFRGRRARFVCPIDVTQRIRAEEALREREAGLRRAQALARLGHVITGLDGAFESWSETLPGLAGVSAADMPRSTRDWLNRLVHPEDRETFRGKSVEAARTGKRTDVEYRIVRADGGVIYMQQVIEPIDGLRWFSTLQDVSEVKHAQMRVMLANEQLEARVLERTAQLETSNRELALATAAADQANRAKSEFLSNMSHELRTPLNAIVGFAQLLSTADEKLRVASRQASFAGHIEKAGRHLLTLINDILNLAQVEAGSLSVAMESLPAGEVLRDCMALIEPLAASRQIRLELDVDESTHVLADRVRLKQVLLNLLSNAVKYNREGGLVHIECAPGPLRRVVMSIADTGPGLRPDQVNALFQPFNRLGQDAAGVQGTGLGLVVTKRLVEIMGGEIGVTSTEGVGSVFRLSLAAEAAAAQTGVSTSQSAPDDRLTAGRPTIEGGLQDRMRTILCVDDDPANLCLVQEVLALRHDVQLLAASNGRLGVELAQAHLPAVILIDNNMPHMSGREALALLRDDPRTSNIPVIALSASATTDAVATGKAAGYFRYLTKPYAVADVLSAVNEALNEVEARRMHGA